jgi:PAS domain S-box-containing protein
MKPRDPLTAALLQLKPSALAAALNAASCAIVIADAKKPDFPLIYVSKAFQTITGYTPAESLGRNCRFLQGADPHQPELKTVRKAIKERKSCEVVLVNHRKDGTRFRNELRLAPVFDDQNHLTHYIGIQTDVTAQLAAKETLETYQRDLEKTVNERTDELARKNTALNEVLGQLELEKKSLRDQILVNVDRLILPLITKLNRGASREHQKALAALEANLKDLTSPFGERLSRSLYRLSPREMEICNLIKNGLGTKEISQLLKSSPATIENQRNTIRKKLRISRSQVNLATFLRSLAA